jgi:hypothetical protein
MMQSPGAAPQGLPHYLTSWSIELDDVVGLKLSTTSMRRALQAGVTSRTSRLALGELTRPRECLAVAVYPRRGMRWALPSVTGTPAMLPRLVRRKTGIDGLAWSTSAYSAATCRCGPVERHR